MKIIATSILALSTFCVAEESSRVSNLIEHADVHKEGCLFCAGIEKDSLSVVERFEHCIAVEDKFPVSKGHILILPYVHIDNWFDAPDYVKQDIVSATEKVKAILDAKYGPDGYNFGTNCGKVAGQTVMHLHCHLIPRYTGDRPKPIGIATGIIPNNKEY